MENKNRAYSDNDQASLHAFDNLNNANSNVGDGNKGSRAFAEYEDATKMSDFNVINSTDPDYAGNSENVAQRTSVDVSKADRGKES